MVLILWENYDYIHNLFSLYSRMWTQSDSSTMCTFLHICMLVCGCDCMYVCICELASTCILFRPSVLAVWWSLKHGNPGIISYAIPLLSTNGDPGSLLLESAQGRNYRTHIHTDIQTQTHIYIRTHMLISHIHTDFKLTWASICSHIHSQWNISIPTLMCTIPKCKHRYCHPYTPEYS